MDLLKQLKERLSLLGLKYEEDWGVSFVSLGITTPDFSMTNTALVYCVRNKLTYKCNFRLRFGITDEGALTYRGCLITADASNDTIKLLQDGFDFEVRQVIHPT